MSSCNTTRRATVCLLHVLQAGQAALFCRGCAFTRVQAGVSDNFSYNSNFNYNTNYNPNCFTTAGMYIRKCLSMLTQMSWVAKQSRLNTKRTTARKTSVVITVST